VADLCRKHSVSPVQFYQWKERFIDGGKTALAGRRSNGVSDEIERLKRLIGELTIANDAFKKTLEGGRRRWQYR
jgi:transposase-like protein